jgi:hypothetical protein
MARPLELGDLTVHHIRRAWRTVGIMFAGLGFNNTSWRSFTRDPFTGSFHWIRNHRKQDQITAGRRPEEQIPYIAGILI